MSGGSACMVASIAIKPLQLQHPAMCSAAYSRIQPDGSSTARTKRNTFHFGHNVAGFELLCRYPCKRYYKQDKNLKEGIQRLTHNFVEWAAYAQGGADAYNVELEYKGKTVILGL
ncbi:hypothetical protein EJ03DRAFT_114155 [Teratosphaeria nubilosa]|uniref:Uncharacterized protein n=1 Tax=Teratosphaeria nubilosa TaxID=161662 RepID=A0A6G1L7B0_9PEZI|nr:hypothetical protein EJ03DRAFT_114155 [Teratosphaeria nubilosa]